LATPALTRKLLLPARARALFAGPIDVAAVCYRLRDDGAIEFLLVRTRAGRWTFPKGGVDGDPTPAAAAAREAWEEAGVRGSVQRRAFDLYLHSKRSKRALPVAAHLCRVFELRRPREEYRDPTWFSPEKAKRRVQKLRRRKYAAEMERVIDSALARIARQHGLN
jgi:8-oxo-dGTP pyrophosphatase MutT (NUDIX family)